MRFQRQRFHTASRIIRAPGSEPRRAYVAAAPLPLTIIAGHIAHALTPISDSEISFRRA
jgi:hypothetical protein